jgi:hypothetical protein
VEYYFKCPVIRLIIQVKFIGEKCKVRHRRALRPRGRNEKGEPFA